MKVKLIAYTQNPVEIIYRSARTCYSAKTPTQMWEDLLGDNAGYGEEFYKKMCNFVEGILKTRHESVLEHANFTFACEGLSRSCLAQITRHRHCSFSVQSQRYVEIKIPYDDLQLMYHHAIELGDELVFSDVLELLDKYFVDVNKDNAECYLNCLLNYAKAIKDGKKAEDARNFLPNATKTNMIITMNLRELIHVCHERLCRHAQYEIRSMVGMMAEEVIAIEPLFKKYLQPKCIALGKCTERESCGFIKHNS